METLFKAPACLAGKVCTPEQAAGLIPEHGVVAASGYTAAGDPKATLLALAARGRAGEIHKIDLITAAQLSGEVENALAEAGILDRRAPFTVSGAVRRLANLRQIRYVEAAMGKMPRVFAAGSFGVPDVAVVEAMGLDEDGRMIPTTSVGMTQLMCQKAGRIIVELNTAQPELLCGVHDVYESPCHTGAVLRSAGERVGRPWIQVDLNKVEAVVFSHQTDAPAAPAEPDETERAVCEQLMGFLERTFPGQRLPPIQTGIGSLSKAILAGFRGSRYRDLTFFCGALQAEMVGLLAEGKAEVLSGGSVPTDPETLELLRGFGPGLRERLVLRSMEVCNGSAAVGGLGVLALNTGIEMDLFGNVNSSHIGGTRLVNGIGGGAAFAANAGLSVMLMPSTRKEGRISCFVPHTPHVDVIHHDVDVVISEYGVADLRGLDDVECARLILQNCAHPDYRAGLEQSLERALAGGGHHPLSLDGAFAWQEQFLRSGTMPGG